MLLINTTTAEIITPGTMLRAVTGPHIGRAFRFERAYMHTDGTPRVHVTRTSSCRKYRAHLHMSPEIFGCKISEEVTKIRHAYNVSRHALGKIDDYLMAGLFALVPLALFEHFHMANTITEAITLGMIGSDGGH